MSRIDEALRRAANEDGCEPIPGADGTERLNGQDLSLLAREPFPVELASVRRSRETSETTDDARRPHEQPSGRTRKRESLFERIDSRLAEKVVADSNMSPMSREQYRRLAAVLHDAQSNA